MSTDIKLKRRLFIGLCCRIFSAAYANKQMPFFCCHKIIAPERSPTVSICIQIAFEKLQIGAVQKRQNRQLTK